ncbi:hypothetical protein GCM10022205_26790 [Spinactinospora alkalitolerans]
MEQIEATERRIEILTDVFFLEAPRFQQPIARVQPVVVIAMEGKAGYLSGDHIQQPHQP